MRSIIIGLVIALIALSACGSAPAPAAPACAAPQVLIGERCCLDANGNGQCDDTEPKSVPQEQAPVVVTPPKPMPVPEPAPEVVTSGQSMAELQKRVADNVKSYAYNFRDVSYKILGDTIRVELGKFFRPDGNNVANAVYLDRKTKTATAYCEGGPTIRRVCDPYQRGPFTVDYAKYYEKLPITWLDDYAGAEVVKVTADAQSIGGIATDRWDLKQSGEMVSLWVLSKYGMPVRIIIDDGTRPVEYNYAGMSVNTVKADDMVPHPDVRV